MEKRRDRAPTASTSTTSSAPATPLATKKMPLTSLIPSGLSLGNQITLTKVPRNKKSDTATDMFSPTAQTNSKKSMCKCFELDCEWRGKKSRYNHVSVFKCITCLLHVNFCRRTKSVMKRLNKTFSFRFLQHLVECHGLRLGRERARNILDSMVSNYDATAKNDTISRDVSFEEEEEDQRSSFNHSIMSTSSASKRGKERLKICPAVGCRLQMRPSNLVRHIKTRHEDMSEEEIKKALADTGNSSLLVEDDLQVSAQRVSLTDI